MLPCPLPFASVVVLLRLSVMSTQMVSDVPSPPTYSDEFLENLRFEDPDADIILCSCDHQEFRVLKLYLIKVSPVLGELIQSASSSHHANATKLLPSIHLSDSGAILSSLLTFVLPIPPLLPSTIEQTMMLLSAAQKYQMDPILSHIRAVVGSQDPPFIRPETAFRVYSLAQTYGLRQEALHAARTTLNFPFTLQDLSSVPPQGFFFTNSGSTTRKFELTLLWTLPHSERLVYPVKCLGKLADMVQ